MKLYLSTLAIFISFLYSAQVPCGTPEEYDTICETSLPYLWNGEYYTAAGTYTQTVPNGVGCDCVYTLYLSVIPTTNDQENITICTADLPYSWHGLQLTNAGNYSDTLQNVYGCDSIINLNLTVISNVGAGTNLSICASDLPYSWQGQSLTTTGIYYDTLQNVANCDSIISIDFTVINSQINTENASVCQANLPYTWRGQEYSVSGLYSDTLAGVNGCDSIVALNLFVILNANVNLIDTTICAGNSVVFLASPASLSCDLAKPICIDGTTTYPNQTNTEAPTGNDYGCLDSQPNPSWFYLTINQAGTLDFAVDQTSINTGGSGIDVDYILYGPYSSYNEAQSYCGNLGAETSGSSVNTIINCSYSGAATETVNVGDVQAGQVYVLMVTNFANEPGFYTFTPGNGSATIDCSVITNDETSILWSTGDTTTSIIATPFETTTYTVTVTQGSCPSVVDSATVTVNQLPEVTLFDQTILTGEVATLTPVVNPEGGTYFWIETGETTPEIFVSPTFNTSYTLEYNYGGCITTAFVNVIVGDAGMDEISAAIWKVFPNPASDNLTIKSTINVQTTVRIISMEGREVAKYTMNGTELNLNVAELANGIYNIQVGQKVIRFVKD
ncbi:MAG: T9SS C-terminal target domain-containing protein [Crocinitomicaceae bacterium]|nr:T9SS C-terminal target domain-containing protein [Crocinitomicaceae bacterium]